MSRSSSSQHSSDDDELSSQHQHRYPIHAIRKRRLPNDTFFDPGNDVCQHYNAFSYIEHEHENHHENDPLVVLSCEVRGCSFVASSYHAYEEHYWNAHVHVCSVCLEHDDDDKVILDNRRMGKDMFRHGFFTSLFLLDLHIEKVHGSDYCFTRPMECLHRYRCLEESCFEHFSSENERLSHLVQVHGYPKWFRFHRPWYKGKKADRKKINGKMKKDMKQDKIVDRKDLQREMDVDKCFDCSQSISSKKARQFDRKKEKYGNIKCKIFATKSGCRRGDKCYFLHERSSNLNDSKQLDIGNDWKAEDNDQSMDINHELADKLSRVKLSVPKYLSFGRRRRR